MNTKATIGQKLSIFSALFCAVILFGSATYGADTASGCDGNGQCKIVRLKDGEIPVPYSTNLAVELADEEFYLLQGRLFFSKAVSYLQVDLHAHPWLATKYRKANPYYLVEVQGKVDYDLRDYVGKVVVLKTRAKGIVRVLNDGSMVYDIKLKLLSAPILNEKK